ncbi:GNAT family N-acetyltransferase [Prosthecomicrobium sp. N25]|uniref:GNAT family N-acetyltransferase n=1 Tax=Prosthecomicrobium sp. N25 TaxID=3129254 RepID=UPI003076B973
MPFLETDRLLLRPYRRDDFPAYAAMRADPAVMRFIGGAPLSREEAWGRFLRQAGVWHHLGFGYFAVLDRVTGAFLGEAGFHDVKRTIEPSIEGTLEAGWSLVSPAWGRGIATEAMDAAIGWASAAWPGKRFTAMIEPAHRASIRVAEKLGFRPFAQTAYAGKPVVLFER